MASTNKTPNYDLPQFIGTDKPSWLGDVNSAMLAIDTAIKGASDKADTASSQAEAAAESASTAGQAAASAQEAAEAAATQVGSVSTVANQALAKATSAETTANQAKTTADTASTKADTAQQTATAAAASASTAQSTAEGAVTLISKKPAFYFSSVKIVNANAYGQVIYSPEIKKGVLLFSLKGNSSDVLSNNQNIVSIPDFPATLSKTYPSIYAFKTGNAGSSFATASIQAVTTALYTEEGTLKLDVSDSFGLSSDESYIINAIIPIE